MTELTEAPDLYELPTDPEERSRFRIDDDGKAAWAMRKARDIELVRAEKRAIAKAEIDRVTEWLTDEEDRLDPDYIFFRGLISDYALRVRDADPDRKSIRTPYGTAQTRAVGGSWDIDEPTVMEWAREHRPELIRVKESVSVTAAKKALTSADGEVVDFETGAVVPGIKVQPSRITTSIDLDLA